MRQEGGAEAWYNQDPYPWEVCVCIHHIRSRVVTPWTVARQALLSIEFSSKNIGVGCHFLLQGSPRPRAGIHASCVSRFGRLVLYLLSHQGVTHKGENNYSHRGPPQRTSGLNPHPAPQSSGPAPGRQAPRTCGFEGQWDLLLGGPQGCGKQKFHS